MSNMIGLIKSAAVEAVEAQKPTSIVYGKVVGVDPVQVQIDQKLTIKEPLLVLTRNVLDYTVDITVAHSTDGGGSPRHTHGYTGRKSLTIHNSLQAGESVLMLRVQGGQKYIVLDRYK